MTPPNPQIILITGTSSGFGLLIAARLASYGHKVVATMRDLAKKDALLKEVEKRGGKIDILPLDVTDPISIQKAVSEAIHRYKKIDVLVNNAGFGMGGAFEDLSQEDIREQMEANFFGAQNVIRAVLPFMRGQKKGRIINISSMAGLKSTPCLGAYNASKWALEGFSESLYYELKFFGIDVVLVEPGTYKTKIFNQNARYAHDFDNPRSPYYAISQYLKNKMMNYTNHCKKDPEKVAALVERLILARNPPFRNFPDIEVRFLIGLRRILPFKVFSWMIRKGLFSGFKF